MGYDTSFYQNVRLPDFVGAYREGKEYRRKEGEREKQQQLAELKKSAYTLGEDGKMSLSDEGFKAYAAEAPEAAYKMQKGLDKDSMEAEKAQYDSKIRQYDLLGRTLGGVKNQEQYDMAKQQLLKAGVDPEDISQLSQTFDPEITSSLAGMSLSQADKLAQEAKDRGFEFQKEKFGYQKEKDARDFGLRKRDMAIKERAAKEKAAKSEDGKELSAQMVQKINEGNKIPTMLQDVKDTIKANMSDFGPIMGRAAQMNPYDTKAQTINAQTRAASQAFGRYMEGGVLRKEDEEKYRKMFPNLSDTPEVAQNKLAVVERLLQQQQNSDIEAFRSQGYDLKGLDKGFDEAKVPDVIAGDRAQKPFTPESLASMSREDKIKALRARGGGGVR